MEKSTVDELIIIPYTGKCEIIQKKIEISPEYYESMNKYELNHNPDAKKKEATHWKRWESDPFAHKEENN